MKLIGIIALTLAIVFAQDDDTRKAAGEIFEKPSGDFLPGLVEVTTKGPESLSPLQKCGEGSDQGVHVCIKYDMCDGITNLIRQDMRTDGFGLIDIRFGANSCDHYLDVCCGIPDDIERGPDPNQPVTVPGRPSTPPPVNPPVTPVVTPVNPPVTSVNPPVTPRPSSLNCGIRNPDGIDFKITGNVNGEAEYGEFPWMVAILKTNYNPSKDKTLALCGGSLIAPNVVLTGAHCVASLKINEYKVRAGEWDTQTTKERVPYQERTVSQAVVHDLFNPQTLANNIAVLVLSSPFEPADNIGTICLPSQGEVLNSRNCLASGWGKDVFGKTGTYQVILKKIELPIVQWQPCQNALRKTRLGPRFNLHKTFICAGGEAGKDTCTGDGGSPLVCPDPKNPGRYVQAGIVSWGIGCGEENIPGVYADVAKFREWIDDKMERLNINTDPYNV